MIFSRALILFYILMRLLIVLFLGCEDLLHIIKNNDKLIELDLSGMISHVPN